MRNDCVIGREDGETDSAMLDRLTRAAERMPDSWLRATAAIVAGIRGPCDWFRARINRRLQRYCLHLPWARLRLAVRRAQAYGLPTPIDGIELPPPVPRPTRQRAYVAGKVLELDAPYHPPPIPRGSRAQGLMGPGGRGLPLPPKDRRVAVQVGKKLIQCSTRLPRWLEEADRPWVANAREALEAVTPKPVQPMALRFEAVAEPQPDRTQEWATLLEQGRRRLT
jgi:hypothetical protein